MKADRVVILAGVVLLHSLALAYLLMQRITLLQLPPMTVFVAPISLDARPPAVERSSAAEPRRAVRSPHLPTVPNARPPTSSQEAATAPTTLPDWAATAEAVVRDQTAAQAERDRQAQALSSRYKPLPAPEASAPALHWDKSRTERMVALPAGGMLIHLNDQCVLVLAPFPIGACALGKPPAHGDLFEHMHDPPKLGDKLDAGNIP